MWTLYWDPVLNLPGTLSGIFEGTLYSDPVLNLSRGPTVLRDLVLGPCDIGMGGCIGTQHDGSLNLLCSAAASHHHHREQQHHTSALV
jgi:hypothetical protein